MKSIFFICTLITFNFSLIFAQTPDEKHLKNLRQLTFGGNNAEAYFSRDSKYISFQSDNPAWGLSCDQIFYMNVEKGLKDPKVRPDFISTSFGRTTCSFFMPKLGILHNISTLWTIMMYYLKHLVIIQKKIL